MECLFDKDYQLLIIKGEPSEYELTEAWHKIYMEYVELTSGEGTGNELYDKMIQVNYIATKIHIGEKIIRHLQISYNEELVNVLRFYGIACKINDKDTVEERYKKLEQVVARIKRWVIDFEVLKKDVESLQAEQTDKVGGYEYFEDSLTAISIFRKTNIQAKDISVRQFVKALKSMEREAMRLAAQQTT